MKKLFCLMLALLFVLMCSCTKNDSGKSSDDLDDFFVNPTEETTGDDTEQGNEGDEGEVSSNVEKTPEELLYEISAYTDSSMGIDTIALSFMDALQNADTYGISELTGGEAYLYNFLYDVSVLSYEIIPFGFDESSRKDDIYYGDELNKYLCVIETEEESEYFPNEKNYYFLATTEFGVYGYPVYYFTPFSNTKAIFKSYYASTNPYEIISDGFVTAYGNTLEVGRNDAEDFDFNNITGFHFIPHTMFALDGTSYYDTPHSMTDINNFIGEVFNGNDGIQLKTKADYDLWVSGEDSDGIYSYDDEIYGCYYGHGGDFMVALMTENTSDKNGVKIVIEGYADYSCFVKARTYTFKFAPEEDGTMPCLYGVDVENHTDRLPVIYSF